VSFTLAPHYNRINQRKYAEDLADSQRAQQRGGDSCTQWENDSVIMSAE